MKSAIYCEALIECFVVLLCIIDADIVIVVDIYIRLAEYPK
jgi:hypothetical protein